jgi:hypothetical protein
MVTNQIKTLLEFAKEAKPTQQRKNISEVKNIPINIPVTLVSGINEKGEQYTTHQCTIDGNNYRIPPSVLLQIQELVAQYPKTKFVDVLRTGKGKDDTRYNVIPSPFTN